MTFRVSHEIALELERVECAAWRDVHAAATPEDRAALGLRARELAGGWVMAADREDSLLQNRALGLGLAEPLTDSVLHMLLAHFRDGPPGFALNLCPFAEPAGVESLLARHGFGTYFHHLKWARGAEPVSEPPIGPHVECVSPEQASQWALLAASIFAGTPAHAAWSARVVGRPGWSHYLAFHGDTPIAVGALFVSGDAAWLGSGGTLERHRRRGAQGALFARRVRDGLAQGVRCFTTETGPDRPEVPGESLRNAERAGFHPAYERPSWIWPLPS